MNRWSGGGKVDRFALDEKARQLGATVQILEKDMDVVSVLEDAVSGGADLLGAAGGDGTQALVAKVAAAHGLPMVVVPAGTRNHFALDLGLDREDPSAALDALSDGVEISIDLGDVGGRPFVNNVSFGLYADIIRRPEYRDAKVDTTLTTLPEVLAADSPPTGLHAERPDGSVIDHPRVVFVGNNPYAKSDDPTPAGTRPRLDTGQLGVDVIAYHSSAEFRALVRAIEMRRTDLGGSRVTWTAPTVTVSDDRGTVSAGVDGEYVEFDSPVILRSRPGALRVRVPADRPGLKASWPPMDEHLFSHLWHILRDGGSAR
jgi:diacylglycerol kinase family enzyme